MGGAHPGWLRDEAAGAGRENLDADHVARYDTKMDAGAAEEVRLLQAHGLGPGSVVVDLGAGTGQFALAAAAAGARVTAVDVSSVMLRRLEAKVAGAGLAVEVVQAGFLTYEHTGPPVDVAYSRFALHHLPDFWKAVALSRLRSMMRTGGVFRLQDVVYDFVVEESSDRIEAWCATGAVGTDVQTEWQRWEHEEHVRDEHSTFRWILEGMLDRSGFVVDDVSYSDDGFVGRYLARAV